MALVVLSVLLNLFTAPIVYSDVLLSSSALDSQCTSDSIVKILVLNYILGRSFAHKGHPVVPPLAIDHNSKTIMIMRDK